LARLLLPFAGAYFLSYFYRTANAVVGPLLVQELSLSAGAVGLLTGTYFLAFALAQVPLGMLLDRFGARRIEPALLLVAASGALAFSAGGSLGGLAAGRALIGLGVSACLMGALHSFSRSFPPERLASLTGWIMTSGGLGALAASAPLEAALRVTGWRQVFVALAAATVAASIWIFRRAPDQPGAGGSEGLAQQWAGVAVVFGSARFWRIVPLGVVVTGGFMAVQGLWSGSWLLHVSGLSRATAADHLTAMNLATLVSYAAIGISATPLARRGVLPVHLVAAGVALALAALAAIAAEATSHTLLLWIAYGAFSSFGTLAYPVAAQGFPAALAGRASTALNLLVFVGAFGIQWGLGAAMDALRAGGLGDAAAHRTAFAGLRGAPGVPYAGSAAPRRRGEPVAP
jgi:predicted MFS family arabinose efflux permease